MIKTIKTRIWLVSICIFTTLLAGCKIDGKNTVSYPEGEDITFSVMSFNLLFGGTATGNSIAESVAVIEASGADIVALQEHVFNGPAIARALGWDIAVFGFDNAIISRYNIIETATQGAVIEFNEGNTIAVFDVHLDPYPYGPYDLRDNPTLTAEELITTAQASRGAKINAYLDRAAAYIDANIPVFFIGDFNEPSHLDWTDETVIAGIRPLAVEWPTSKAVLNSGFNDVYRSLYPDPVTHVGYTWTPKPGENEIHDRIDYIYLNSDKVSINRVDLLGPNDDVSSIVVDPYPSDHRAIVSELVLSVVES